MENMLDGDWSCPNCGAHCFASRNSCFKCRAPRPDDGYFQGGDYGQEDGGYQQGGRGGFGGGYGGGRGGGAFGGGRNRFRPGDWSCQMCNAHNYASRQNCFKCGGDRGMDDYNNGGAGGYYGGAGGGNRGYDNYGAGGYGDGMRQGASAFGMNNRRGGGGGGAGFGGGRRRMQPGDWMCECGAHCFASRQDCFKCGATRPADAETFQGRRMQPGDWMCECGAHCFASRQECFKCGLGRPADAQMDNGNGDNFGNAPAPAPAGVSE